MATSFRVGLSDEVLDALPDATAVINQAGRIVAVNKAWRMFALDNGGDLDSAGVGVNYLEVCERSARTGCEAAAEVVAGIRSVLTGKSVHSELEYPCPSPAAGRWFLLRINPVGSPPDGAVVSHVNITRRVRAEQDLAHKAAHDPLTGLANRTLLNARLAAALGPRAGRAPTGDIGVLYLDLDGFKSINDTYGHEAGDEVLLTTAHRLRDQVRPQDTVARLGGDEFAIVAPRITATGLPALAQRITVALAEPHLVHGTEVVAGASVGTYLSAPGQSAEDALSRADAAMYAVKRHRKSRPQT